MPKAKTAKAGSWVATLAKRWRDKAEGGGAFADALEYCATELEQAAVITQFFKMRLPTPEELDGLELTESDILIAIATAQGILSKAAQQLLARDKYDGLRAVGWLRLHNNVFDKIRDECEGGPVDNETIELANRLAGEPE